MHIDKSRKSFYNFFNTSGIYIIKCLTEAVWLGNRKDRIQHHREVGYHGNEENYKGSIYRVCGKEGSKGGRPRSKRGSGSNDSYCIESGRGGG